MKVTVVHTAFEDAPRIVAEVNAPHAKVEEALEYAYRWTNNVMGSWSRTDIENNGDANDDVEVVKPVGDMGHRSTSVGDYMRVDGSLYRVAMMGFEPAESITTRKSI